MELLFDGCLENDFPAVEAPLAFLQGGNELQARTNLRQRRAPRKPLNCVEHQFFVAHGGNIAVQRPHGKLCGSG